MLSTPTTIISGRSSGSVTRFSDESFTTVALRVSRLLSSIGSSAGAAVAIIGSDVDKVEVVIRVNTTVGFGIALVSVVVVLLIVTLNVVGAVVSSIPYSANGTVSNVMIPKKGSSSPIPLSATDREPVPVIGLGVIVYVAPNNAKTPSVVSIVNGPVGGALDTTLTGVVAAFPAVSDTGLMRLTVGVFPSPNRGDIMRVTIFPDVDTKSTVRDGVVIVKSEDDTVTGSIGSEKVT